MYYQGKSKEAAELIATVMQRHEQAADLLLADFARDFRELPLEAAADIFRLEDQAGSVKCVLWPEPYRRHGSLLADEATIVVTGRAEISEEGLVTVMGEKVTELTQAVQQKARELVIRFPQASAELYEEVKKLLENSPGECDVFIDLKSDDGLTVRIRAHPSLKVQGSVAIENSLTQLGCEVSWDGFPAPPRVATASGSAY